MKKLQIRVTKNNGDYVILEENDVEYIMHLFGWYEAHKSFFNGKLSVEEVRREVK